MIECIIYTYNQLVALTLSAVSSGSKIAVNVSDKMMVFQQKEIKL
jgi:hypothetical protein